MEVITTYANFVAQIGNLVRVDENYVEVCGKIKRTYRQKKSKTVGFNYKGNFYKFFNSQFEMIPFKEVKVSGNGIKVEALEVKKDKVENQNVVKHSKYDMIKSCVEQNVPVYLYGPAGSGKNFTLESVAHELDLEFYFTNSVQQEYKLTGFIDAGGIYHETEFYKAFKNGGLFFLDEMDASIPEVLVLLNAAIANGYFEFPNGRIEANENFRVVAAGNTIGSGADENYTGRMVLDQATLDRFVTIEFDYDIGVERNLAKGDNDLVLFVRSIRRASNEMGIRATFSYRCIINTKKLQKTGMKLEDIMMIAVFKGMDKQTIKTVMMKVAERNQYVDASMKIAA